MRHAMRCFPAAMAAFSKGGWRAKSFPSTHTSPTPPRKYTDNAPGSTIGAGSFFATASFFAVVLCFGAGFGVAMVCVSVMRVAPGSDDDADIVPGTVSFFGVVFATSTESFPTSDGNAVGSAARSVVCCAAPSPERECEKNQKAPPPRTCLLYTSDAAD